MKTGLKLVLIGTIIAIAGFVLEYESPNLTNGTIMGISSIAIIVVGAFLLYEESKKTKP